MFLDGLDDLDKKIVELLIKKRQDVLFRDRAKDGNFARGC